MNQTIEILVDEKYHGERLDLFLTAQLPHYSRTRLQGLIKDGHVTLQGKSLRCRDEVSPGDCISIQEPLQKTLAQSFPEDIPLTILYEDDDLLIIDKPAGMVVHVGPDHERGTLVNALLHHCKNLHSCSTEAANNFVAPVLGASSMLYTLNSCAPSSPCSSSASATINTGSREGVLLSSGSEPYRPGIVHRLDKETSGCIIVAKNNSIHAALALCFSERTIKKTYLAIVTGKPRHRKGTITLSIGRHPTQRLKMTERRPPAGREAITHYEVIASTAAHSLIACFPQTGRMHQIRVHLQHLGHPIVGDPIYGKRDSWNRHLLHAWKLEFAHPRDGRLIVCEAPLPDDFKLVPYQRL
ncbi:MAG: hypothetical protein A3F67_05640 [Verrucomicrobia bacterium RIFCSPHIGHO2_12_FULL_41_10]|nr:MAG: hypothetical protein A3F67_05640 [Verrucomicrobia bacterium RIFCSPHIGHO2_12_FULL_41_10]HLB34715.1 RluA family pseudouridine synthase [Chthoniobacterales bacterium]